MSEFHYFRPVQRFKGTEPVEEVTEQVKAVKIEEKPKEVKTEVVDEVLLQDVLTNFFLLYKCTTIIKRSCSACHRVHRSTPSRC